MDFKGKRKHHIDLTFAPKILSPTELSRSPHQIGSLKKLRWRLLPPGEMSVERLRASLEKLSKSERREKKWDGTRLAFLLECKPVNVYVGTDEFDGYLAFQFSGLDGAILENPFEGNALYVFGEDWRELCAMSKSELFSQAEGKFERIVHAGRWKDRVQSLLNAT